MKRSMNGAQVNLLDMNRSMNGAQVNLLDMKRSMNGAQVNLLDMKRSMNVNIFLRQFHLAPERIVELIGRGDEGGARGDAGPLGGAERLRGFIKILPEPDEVQYSLFYFYLYSCFFAPKSNEERECYWSVYY